MRNTIEELTDHFRQTCQHIGETEEDILRRVRDHLHVSRNTSQEFEEKLTFGQQLADRIAAFVGSWPFIILFLVILVAWMILNSVILTRGTKPFDPYPYILLNLMLSMVASLQAPLIMMSQNRQSAKDRFQAEHDYEVNLKAELEILALHRKIDTLREVQWEELVAMQQEQIRLLTELNKTRNA